MPFNKLAPLTALLLGLPALAVHNKNAGPEKVELKFKLPPPAPLSPEEAMKSFQVGKGLPGGAGSL